MKVRYRTRVGYRTEYDDVNRVWQLAYILAPARSWGGFGTLDIVVRIPEGWSHATEPALTLYRGELLGTYTDIPADALTISLAAPETRTVANIRRTLFGLWVSYAIWSLWWLTRWSARKGASPPREFRGFVRIAAGGMFRSIAIGIGHLMLMATLLQVRPMFADKSQSGFSGDDDLLTIMLVCISPFVLATAGLFGMTWSLIFAGIHHRRPTEPDYRSRIR